MNITILGAGEVGKQLAWTLSTQRNSVAVVDQSAELLMRIRERLDLLTVQGDCANVSVLRRANIGRAELVIAVTGSDASNVLACRIAKNSGARRTICRLSSGNFFGDSAQIDPTSLGIDHVILPQDACVDRIFGVLDQQHLVERILFAPPQAEMSALRIPPGSPLVGARLNDFPKPEMLQHIRFSALVRDQHLFTPTGDTVFLTGDEVYVAGTRKGVQDILHFNETAPRPSSMVIVVGTTKLARNLINRLVATGRTVRVIEEDPVRCNQMLDEMGEKILVINGTPTEAEVLEEAEAADCGAFISVLRNDEQNILGCILAKRQGAGKVITVTNKAEYMDIVPAMQPIDCGFSPRLVAVNSVLNLLGSHTARIHAILHRVNAYVYEFDVQHGAAVCGHRIADCANTPPATFSLVMRDNETLAATGDVVLQENDRVAVISTPDNEKRLERMFSRRGVFH